MPTTSTAPVRLASSSAKALSFPELHETNALAFDTKYLEPGAGTPHQLNAGKRDVEMRCERLANGFVSAAFTCGFAHGDHEIATVTAEGGHFRSRFDAYGQQHRRDITTAPSR